MERLNFFATSGEVSKLRLLSERTEFTLSDWLRRMIDYCLQDRVLNELLPSMSGSVSVRAGG